MSRSDRKHMLNITNNYNMADYFTQKAAKGSKPIYTGYHAQKWLKGDKNKLKRGVGGV